MRTGPALLPMAGMRWPTWSVTGWGRVNRRHLRWRRGCCRPRRVWRYGRTTTLSQPTPRRCSPTPLPSGTAPPPWPGLPVRWPRSALGCGVSVTLASRNLPPPFPVLRSGPLTRPMSWRACGVWLLPSPPLSVAAGPCRSSACRRGRAARRRICVTSTPKASSTTPKAPPSSHSPATSPGYHRPDNRSQKSPHSDCYRHLGGTIESPGASASGAQKIATERAQEPRESRRMSVLRSDGLAICPNLWGMG